MDNKPILELLYEKQKELSTELNKVNQAIAALEGSEISLKTNVSNDYPTKGTWKDKIFFIVKDLKHPLVSEIIEHIYKRESNVPKKRLDKTITLYCSALGRSGELKRIKEGKTYRYSLK